MYKACIFDLDGTLADTIESISHCSNEALARVGLPPQEADSYKQFAGDGYVVLLKRCLKAAGDEELSKLEDMKAAYNEIFATDCMYHVAPFAGIEDLIENLKMNGIKTAVLSNKPDKATKEVVGNIFKEGSFDCVQGLHDGIKKKPDPDGALEIAQAFGIKPEECVYVGDTDTDMKTGNSAGMFTVGVTWGFRSEEELRVHNAHAIVNEASEIFHFFE